MTDLSDQILNDPRLRQWPRRTPNPGRTRAEPAADNTPPEPVVTAALEPESAGPDDPAAAIDKVRSLIDPFIVDVDTIKTPGKTASSSGIVTPEPGAEHNSEDNNCTDSPAGTDNSADAATGPADAPLAFDAIAVRPNAFADRIAEVKDWAESINWKSPATLGYAAAAALAAITVVVWWAGSGSAPQVPTAQIASTSSATVPAPAPPALATDAPIPASAVVSASARCPAPSSDPMNALRPDSAQPWICVRAWQIDGQLLKIIFDRPYVISAVSIVPGASTEIGGEDQWVKYRTVSRLSWTFNDPARTTVSQTTGDRRELLPMPVTSTSCATAPDCPIVASAVTLTIQSTSEPSNLGSIEAPTTRLGADYTAFAVSRIEIVGHPAS